MFTLNKGLDPRIEGARKWAHESAREGLVSHMELQKPVPFVRGSPIFLCFINVGLPSLFLEWLGNAWPGMIQTAFKKRIVFTIKYVVVRVF